MPISLPIGWLRGISIGIVSNNNRVRAAAAVPCSATDMVAKVSIDSYLEQQHSLKMIPKRLSFDQYLISIDPYID